MGASSGARHPWADIPGAARLKYRPQLSVLRARRNDAGHRGSSELSRLTNLSVAETFASWCHPRLVLFTRRSVRLWLLAVVWLAVFVGLYVFFVHTSAGRGLDERIFNAIPRHHSVWFRLSGALLGSEVVWALLGVAATLALGLRRRQILQLVVGLATAGTSVLMAELLKHVLLSRPTAGATAAVSNSFPSGHTVTAAAVVVAVWFVSGDRWRPRVVTVGALLRGLVGLVTMVQQWHRLSDVLSAYALVAACACAGGAILDRWAGSAATRSTGSELS